VALTARLALASAVISPDPGVEEEKDEEDSAEVEAVADKSEWRRDERSPARVSVTTGSLAGGRRAMRAAAPMGVTPEAKAW
jgi:hypothetical protein